MKPSVSSLYQAIPLQQETPPLLIGERSNPNGSKKFRECLLADDFDGCLRIGLDQEAKGAQVLDLCAAYAGRDEKADLTRLLQLYAESVKIPLMIDSTSPECIEECLRLHAGRAIINSINLEDGGDNLERICRAAKKYGAAVVALTIDQDGMAMTADEKVRIAGSIYDLAVNRYGLRPQDILFDPLTFTIGSGDESLRDAAIRTLEAIRRIKQELPGVFTLLGLSNISFGLPPAARKILNSVFLHEAVGYGLDAAIIDAGKILPLAQVSDTDRKFCLDLIHDQRDDNETTPLMSFIEHFSERQDTEEEETTDLRPEELLHQKVVRGDKDGIDDLLASLLCRTAPLDIVNQVLVPAMRHVGELFGKGELLLPFVLQSAEVMKTSVAWLEPHMEKSDQVEGVKVLLATVQGDVHDIGKNLVDILLSNNGYKVFNIGIKVPAESIIQKAQEYNVDIIGLSGLLVKSAIVMQESMPQYRDAGLTTPILLGGAALTPEFVVNSCVTGYNAPVVYCADAFAGLKAVRDFEEGKLASTSLENPGRKKKRTPGLRSTEIDRNQPKIEPPFLGVRHITDIDPAHLFPYVNEQALFRGRWGYRRTASTSSEEYADLVINTVQPHYDSLRQRSLTENLLEAKAAYGYFSCYSEGDTLHIEADGETYPFLFPRQQATPNLCITDYFRTDKEGGDIAAFFVVTIGEKINEEIQSLFAADAYHDYLMLHGFSVEVTDALAEYWHEVMRQELGIDSQKPDTAGGYITQAYQGSRYGFGYPACPDLDAHKMLFRLLQPENIGVTLTENMEMVPEQSTSAIIAHHPQAKYFAV